MKPITVTNLLLSVIALLLFAIATRPLRSPEPVQAQASHTDSLFIEPGVFMLRAPDNRRQALGKVVVDLRTGRIWGFPTYNQLPYPMSVVETRAQTSRPFELGRFAFEDITR
jgi:hypothetical protein